MLNVLKVFIGIILGVLTLSVLGVGAGYYFFVTNLGAKPAKPKFAEERVQNNIPKPVVEKAAVQPTPQPKPESKEKEPSEKPAEELPPGAYSATVTWGTGVLLRKEPTATSEKNGSVGFKEKIVVLKANDDKSWVQVRNSKGSAEGWLKIGNIERDPASN